MKVLIVGVAYNSYNCIGPFVDSIDRAASRVENLSVAVVIADNTEEGREKISVNTNNISVSVIYHLKNVGYLNGALMAIDRLRSSSSFDYDYIAISNVDLRIHEDFFEELLLQNSEKRGWLAPDVYTLTRSVHDNPFMMKRPTEKNFKIWRFRHSNEYLFGILKKIAMRKKRASYVAESCKIYAGHGSFMLFTRSFFEANSNIQFPSFMYCEEIFLSELVHKAGLEVWYVPSLKVENTGSVSVDILGNKWKCIQNLKSLDVVYNLFFTENEKS